MNGIWAFPLAELWVLPANHGLVYTDPRFTKMLPGVFTNVLSGDCVFQALLLAKAPSLPLQWGARCCQEQKVAAVQVNSVFWLGKESKRSFSEMGGKLDSRAALDLYSSISSLKSGRQWTVDLTVAVTCKVLAGILNFCPNCGFVGLLYLFLILPQRPRTSSLPITFPDYE